MQPELLEKCGQPSGHEEVPGGHLPHTQCGGAAAGSVGQHVRPQQLQAREASQEAGPIRGKILQL